MLNHSIVELENAQSVIVYFRCVDDDLQPLHALERDLSQAIIDAGAGVYDGHEVALLEGDDAYLFMYGPDAERLFDVVRPVLQMARMMAGAKVTLRYGSPDDEDIGERYVAL